MTMVSMIAITRSLDARLHETLAGLGLSEHGTSLLARELRTLSPGQRARLRLAALLVLRPESPILDEPTNHLDDDAVAFLSQTVRQWDGPVIVSSHDRAFIEHTATVIYDMDVTVWRELAKARGSEDCGELHRTHGNYSDYLALKKTAQAKQAQIHAEQQAHKHQLHKHQLESMQISRGGVRLETATRKEKKFLLTGQRKPRAHA